jgi:hypothetical protein
MSLSAGDGGRFSGGGGPLLLWCTGAVAVEDLRELTTEGDEVVDLIRSDLVSVLGISFLQPMILAADEDDVLKTSK